MFVPEYRATARLVLAWPPDLLHDVLQDAFVSQISFVQELALAAVTPYCCAVDGYAQAQCIGMQLAQAAVGLA